MTREAMENKLINYSVEGGVAVIELNDPPANTYTHEMMRDLDDAILEARLDEEVHVVVIRGAGDKFFCAGANIKMLLSATPQFRYFFSLHGNETLLRMENTQKLIIAAINGHAVGGGLEIALACDMRIAKKGPGMLGVPEINLGLLPGMGGTQRLPRIIGKGKALELLTTGRTISVDEAHQIGLVNHVFDEDNFFEKVIEFARQFVPPAKASKAVGLIKRSVQTGLELPLAEALAVERELLQQLFESDDAHEGLEAYSKKRQAQFKGR
ncbi:MAG TPA: enoyl-CoA hydratase/isomerase family protein [Blastocatellia bacterium]|jgi:enoyl-CoA hydratase/carnithine racemase|nr:enoyl-CoA hydratase/isomerase family protein [Blastocatellia bacterium]